MTRALITGITGQDGSFLAEQLEAEGVEVFGLVRDLGHPRREWIERLVPSVRLVVGDLRDPLGLEAAIERVQPDEIYNLAAVTTPGEGWTAEPTPLVGEVTGLGAVNLLRATLRAAPNAHLVQASSSAIYDPGRYGLYGVAKRLAHDAVIGFRERHNLFAANAVLFSHSSTRQSPRFLIRRIVRHVADVKRGRTSDFVMTNRVNRRDWGHARDYVRALPLLARMEYPCDHDVRTGLDYPVFAVAVMAAEHLRVDLADVTAGWPESPSLAVTGEVEPPEIVTHPSFTWQPESNLSELVRGLTAHEIGSAR